MPDKLVWVVWHDGREKFFTPEEFRQKKPEELHGTKVAELPSKAAGW